MTKVSLFEERFHGAHWMDPGAQVADPRHEKFAGEGNTIDTGASDAGAALALADVEDAPIFLAAGAVFRVDSSLVLTGRIRADGGVLRPAAGVTITLSYAPDAGRYPVFDLSLGGTVTYAANAVGECTKAEWHGCRGDNGVTDNAPAARAASAAAVAGSLPLDFGPGRFAHLTSNVTVTLPAGGRFEMRGAGPLTVIKRGDGVVASDFWSLFIFASSGAGEVEAISLHDFAIDGNGTGNPLPGGAGSFDWEHAADIRLSPSATCPFKSVVVSNINTRDPIADTLWINTQYVRRLTVDRMVSTDRSRTRSDITFSYFPTYTKITNSDFVRIEQEALSAPIEGHALLQVDTIRCSATLDLDGHTGVRYALTNVDTADLFATGLTGYWSGGRVQYPSTKVDPRHNSMRGFVFDHVKFILTPNASNVVEEIRIVGSSGWHTDATYVDCRFEIDSALDAATLVAPYAVGITPKDASGLDPDKAIRFIRCWFDSRFDRSIESDRPGYLYLKDNDYAGQNEAFRFLNGTITSHLILDGGDWSRVAGLFANIGGGNLAGSLTVKNVEVGVEHTGFTALASFSGFTVRSGRRIWVTATPTGGGIAGDRAVLAAPTTGGACEWICTSSSATAATWQPIAQAGVLTSVAATPAFIGQRAVAGGEGYTATGVGSAADWQQTTP